MVHGQVAHDAGLNLYFFCICLPFNLVACLKLVAAHNVHVLEHLHAAVIEIAFEDDRAALLAVESSAHGLFNPFVAISIAVEVDRLACADILADDIDDGAGLVLALGDESIHTCLEVSKSLGNGSVENNHGTGTVSL